MNGFLEAKGMIDKNSLTEVRRWLLPTFIRPVIFTLGTLLLLASFFYMPHSLIISVSFLLFTFILYITYRYSLNAIVEQYLHIMEVFFHTKRLVYALVFQEEYLRLTSLGKENTPLYISYLAFYRVIETKNYYLMTSDQKIPVIIEKDSFTASKEDWKSFIRAKCTNVKKLKLIE